MMWIPLCLRVQANNLLWLSVTVGAYLLGCAIQRALRGHPAANPVLIAIAVVSGLLALTHTPYDSYFRSTQLLTFLLAPATVALGIPLEHNLVHVRRSLLGISLGLFAGSLVSMLSGAVLVRLLGGEHTVVLSMLPKAVTTPIAMAVAEQIGGKPALTASLAIIGGIIAAVTLRLTLSAVRVHDWRAIGLAAGTAGSGVAAAHVAPSGETAAAFAAVGIGLNGILTAIAAPVLAGFFR
jgi:putative effector of murein hydrolase